MSTSALGVKIATTKNVLLSVENGASGCARGDIEQTIVKNMFKL